MAYYNRHRDGARAEMHARLFLENLGFQCLAQNYTSNAGEIDLIMQQKRQILFVEVRIRNNKGYGNAIESLSLDKQNKVKNAALHFLQIKNWLYKVISRFDII